MDPSLNLQKPDALMDPEVQNNIEEYIERGGDINSMISFLSEGYKGNFHIIDAFGFLLQGLGVNFREPFERFLKKEIVQNFNQKLVDQKFDIEHPPECIESLSTSKLWVSIITDLLKQYPTSNFLLYSFEKICQKSPQYVNMIPPCRLSFESYKLVISSHLPILKAQSLNTKSNQKLLKNFLNIITADDLTLSHTAFLLDRNQDVPLINAIVDSLENRKSSQKTFLKLLMRLENCDDETIENLQSNKPLTVEMIMQLSLLGTRSAFLQDYSIKRMTKELFNPHFDEERRQILIKWLIILTNTKIDDEKFTNGIRCFLLWKYQSSSQIGLSLYSAQVKFCAVAMLPVISDRILSSNSVFCSDRQTPPTVERLLMCEIAYWHRELIPRIFDIVQKGIETTQSRRNIDNDGARVALAEFYEILVALFELGDYKDVLEIFTKKLADGDADLKRKALTRILAKALPPFSKDFLSVMLKTLTHPDVKALFFPSKGVPPLPVQVSGLEVVFRFTDRVNKDDKSASEPNEVPIYDDLRSNARRAVEIARGQKQHTLVSYFK